MFALFDVDRDGRMTLAESKSLPEEVGSQFKMLSSASVVHVLLWLIKSYLFFVVKENYITQYVVSLQAWETVREELQKMDLILAKIEEEIQRLDDEPGHWERYPDGPSDREEL